MKKTEELQKKWQNILWYVGCMIIVLATVAWYKVISYDTETIMVDASTQDSKVSFSLSNDNESNDSWKTTVQLSDDPEDFRVLTGTTYSANIVNNNKHSIKDWTLRINILQECYLNGFWNGCFEVHQFRDGIETVEVVDRKNLDISSLKIECNTYADALMIQLKPGDYLVYIPSEREGENIVKAENSTGIGFIFYYKGNMDLSDYVLSYNNDLKMRDEILFEIVGILVLIWLGALAMLVYLRSTIKKMRTEMNSQIRNMSIMADMYLEVFLIDVVEDSCVLIKGNQEKRFFQIEGKHVQENINKKIVDDCNEQYQAGLLQFLDLKTVKDRMKDSSSIFYEWIDEEAGWCSVRLFCVGKNKNQIALTLQDINEEKSRINAVEDRIRMAEFTQVVNGSFIGTIAFALNDIAQNIQKSGTMLSDKLSSDADKVLAESVISGSKHLILLQNTLFDMFTMESKRFVLNQNPYNIHDMLRELRFLAMPFVARDKYEFIVDVDENIPSSLVGDRSRMEQMLMVLLLSSLMVTQNGYVKLSVFGKNLGTEEELIFSIRDTAMGFSEAQIKEINAFISGARIEALDNAALVYLKIINDILGYMKSELKVVSVQGEGSEFYFSLKQEIR